MLAIHNRSLHAETSGAWHGRSGGGCVPLKEKELDDEIGEPRE